MKTTIYFILLLAIVSSCSHRIVRTGYQASKTGYRNCDIAVKKFMTITAADSLIKVGEIKLGESGFSTSCSEEHAIEILRNEGCSLDASIINIVEERRPDLLSTCYRCRAEFYKSKGTFVKPADDESLKSGQVKERVARDRSKNTVITILAVAAGFVLGYYLFQ